MKNHNLLVRILHSIYPAVVFVIAAIAWGTSTQVETARLAPPPVATGFNFYWNPILSTQYGSEKKQKADAQLKNHSST